MRRRRFVLTAIVAAVIVSALAPDLTYADDCQGLADCAGTAEGARNLTILFGLLFLLLLLGSLIPGGWGVFFATILTVRDVVELFSGRDLVTGEPLPWWKRVLGVLPVTALGAGSASRWRRADHGQYTPVSYRRLPPTRRGRREGERAQRRAADQGGGRPQGAASDRPQGSDRAGSAGTVEAVPSRTPTYRRGRFRGYRPTVVQPGTAWEQRPVSSLDRQIWYGPTSVRAVGDQALDVLDAFEWGQDTGSVVDTSD